MREEATQIFICLENRELEETFPSRKLYFEIRRCRKAIETAIAEIHPDLPHNVFQNWTALIDQCKRNRGLQEKCPVDPGTKNKT